MSSVQTSSVAVAAAPTHAIVREDRSAVEVGSPSDLFPLLAGKWPYQSGYRLVKIDMVQTRQDGNTVSAVTLDRVERQNNALAELALSEGIREGGWSNARPQGVDYFVPLGTRVIQDGDRKFVESRRSHSEQPLIEDALSGLINTVKAERRSDFVCDVRDLEMTDQGLLKRKGSDKAGLVMEKNGFKGILTRCNNVLPSCFQLFDLWFSGGNYKAASELFNNQIATIETEKPVKIRVRRQQDGTATLFAAVSETYTVHDADQIAAVALRAFSGMGLRGTVNYDRESTKFHAQGTWHADKIVDLGAGDAFRAGIWCKSGDAANSAFKGGIVVYRNQCRNFIILSEDYVKTVSVRHSGDAFASRVNQGIHRLKSQADRVFEVFAKDWGLTRQVTIADAFPEAAKARNPVKAAYEEIIESLAPDQKRLLDLELLLKGYNMEPGETLADLINGITRVHEFGSIDRNPEIEEIGGIVFAKMAKKARELVYA